MLTPLNGHPTAVTSEKHPHCILTACLTCLIVASTVVFSILYEVLSTLPQVTMSLSLNYIIDTTTEYICFTLIFFSFQLLFILDEVVNGYNILLPKFLRF